MASQPRKVPMEGQEDGLKSVLGVGLGESSSAAHRKDQPGIAIDKLSPRPLVATETGRHQLSIMVLRCGHGQLGRLTGRLFPHWFV